MTPDEFEKSLSETEMALFMGIGMVMYSIIEMGGNRDTFYERLTTHEKNFAALRQKKASAVMTFLKQGIDYTRTK